METTVSREVAASPERVWAVMTDIERSPKVLAGVATVERLDAGRGFGVGTRWRETRTMFGRQATEEMAVTAVDTGRSYTVEADTRGVHYRSVLRVEALGPARSRLSMTFGSQPSTTAGKLLAATVGRLFAPATRKALQGDVDDIAACAEAPPSG